MRTRGGGGDQPASIHDRVLTKEAGLADRLHYDDHERRSGLVRLLPPDATEDAWADATVADLGDFVDHAFDVVSCEPGRLVLSRDGTVAGPDGGVLAGDGRPHDHPGWRSVLSDPRAGR